MTRLGQTANGSAGVRRIRAVKGARRDGEPCDASRSEGPGTTRTTMTTSRPNRRAGEPTGVDATRGLNAGDAKNVTVHSPKIRAESPERRRDYSVQVKGNPDRSAQLDDGSEGPRVRLPRAPRPHPNGHDGEAEETETASDDPSSNSRKGSFEVPPSLVTRTWIALKNLRQLMRRNSARQAASIGAVSGGSAGAGPGPVASALVWTRSPGAKTLL